MADLDQVLGGRLAELAASSLRRELRELRPTTGTRTVTLADGRPLLNLASNDYLGLAGHPAVKAAAAEATAVFGAGSGASRLVCGSYPVHHELERELARFKGTSAALGFATGFATALGTIPALVGPGDYVLLDRLSHACLVDAARLSGAQLRVFRHNDVGDLERLLRWVDGERQRKPSSVPGRGQALIVTESVFSMDGDVAPLAAIVAAKERHGAWLLVDEAHATGVLGPGARGTVATLADPGGVEVTMGTLGKALGAAGGFVAGSTVLCDYLVNRARSFVFSTAPVPAAAAAARAAVGIVDSPEGATLVGRLWDRLHELHRGLGELGWALPTPTSAILPLVVGEEAAVVALAAALREEGLFVPGIRYPTVPRGRARLRVTLSAAHEAEDVVRFLAALHRAMDRTGVRPLTRT